MDEQGEKGGIKGRVVRVLSHAEFEAELDAEAGDVVRAGDIIAVVTSIHQEEPDYVKYLSDLEKEEIKKFLPDVAEGKKIAKCVVLCRADLSEARKSPKIGENVEKVDDIFLRELHFSSGEFRIPYLIPLLQKCKDVSIARSLLYRLMELIPEEKELLKIILAEIEYSMMRGVEL
ncbi:hypothetical protein [Archaeoglobus veneficus]|uniref:Uncharacterized protein n=1 Tax=Archaeoglobus veneficus (strain DSM 11195 / SNP6) TaxID=693661 RepID=F2KR68_ARCVS|nr:hypothetical protein [Archaeoglobus veneficus]AEA46705.1 hypothetical protein Arcve_0685 [Archaeoglobus veneficus SNP6]